MFLSSDNSFSSSGNHAPAHSIKLPEKVDWTQLKYGLSEIMQMNMYGVPMTGVDVCGVWGDSTKDDEYEQICARWLQMHAYLPFVRQHYPAEVTVGTKTAYTPMEPWNLPTAKYNKMAQNALLKRYEFLPYFYTLLFQSSDSGGSVVEPMFFQNSGDALAYADFGSFMIGGIKMTPVMQKDSDTTKITTYFP
jgi:alpha-glucosidase (family GH31 glycosyl hydrolase)